MYFVQKIFSETISKKTTEGSAASEGVQPLLPLPQGR